MRHLLGIFIISFIILLSGCVKDPFTPDPLPPAPVIPAKIQQLVGKTWQVLEVNNMTNCVNTHYVRGAAGNTGANYDPVRFTFKADSTGTHTDILGSTYPITWYFQGDSTRIKVTVLAPTTVVYNWNLVEIWDNKFIATTAIVTGGIETLNSTTMVPTTTVTIPPPALTRTQMLTEKPWIVDEVFDNSGCTIKHYLKGAAGNTGANYSIMRFKFNADGTGTHSDVIGGTYTISWQFTSADERNLRITVNGSTPVIYNWNQFEITQGKLHTTTAIGSNVLDAARFVTTPDPLPPVTPAKIQMLIGKTWQPQEVNNMTNCVNTHYVRGAAGNTGANYDIMRLTFNADGTGSNTDVLGGTYPITWNFITGDSSRMRITVNGTVVYNWNLVEIWNDKFITTSPQSIPGSLTLGASTWIPTTAVTPTPPPAQTRTQMLTAKEWRIQETYDYSNCASSINHFLLNASGNTGANYAIMRFKFNAGGTGTHTDVLGGNYNLTWQWTSTDERNLRIVVNGTVTYNWNQVEIMPGVLYGATAMGTNVLDAYKMITIP